jgi:hypothetical protein
MVDVSRNTSSVTYFPDFYLSLFSGHRGENLKFFTTVARLVNGGAIELKIGSPVPLGHMTWALSPIFSSMVHGPFHSTT